MSVNPIQKVLFISGRESTANRNAMFLRALKNCDVEVIECTSTSKYYVKRFLTVIVKYFFCRHHCDLIFIGFFGQPLVPLVKKFSKKPIIFDVFLSSYDTLCFDRKLINPQSIVGRFLYNLDKYSCELSDIVILDTEAHINYFVETFGLSETHFEKVYVSADDSIFKPIKVNKNNKKFKIFYYCTYHPLHGVEYIIKSAKLLEKINDIEFEIMGDGMEFEKIKRLSEEMNIINVKFKSKIPLHRFYNEVRYCIAEADVCLGGHFSPLDKAKQVIAAKTFEFIAMKKPVIVGDNPANRELLEDMESAIFVKHADPEALSAAILMLKENENLKNRIAEGGYKVCLEKCANSVTENIIRIMIKSLNEAK